MADRAAGEGLVLVNKPAGPTSHDVVFALRRRWQTRTGHAGTLDPFAQGLLLVLCGRATRLCPYFQGLDKSYRARARFGAVSQTGDPTGAITVTGKSVSKEAVAASLAAFRGSFSQVVPPHAAVKVDGQPLYRKARRGEAQELPVRPVRVGAFDLLSFDESDQTVHFHIEVSKGTYIRRVISDLGEALGCGAYTTGLIRTRVGPFDLTAAHTLDRLAEAGKPKEFLIPHPDALSFIDPQEVDEKEALECGQGKKLKGAQGPTAVFFKGSLCGIWDSPQEGYLAPLTVFSPPLEAVSPP